MSTVAAAVEKKRSFVSNVSDDGPKPMRWSLAEFLELSEQGHFDKKRVELVQGEIIIMPSPEFRHTFTTDALFEFLLEVFGDTAWVRNQAPIHAGGDNCLEPDVSVVAGHRNDYQDHPNAALFVAETSISSLNYDRTQKLPLYARIGVPEYWILNVALKQVEVHTQPVQDRASITGFSYANHVIRVATEVVSLGSHPAKTITVSQLFR